MKIELLVVLVLVTSAAYAQQKDTTVILQPDRVEIVSDSDVLSVKVDKQGESFEASLFNEDATLELKEHRLNLVAPFMQRKRWEMRPHTSSLIPIYEVAAGFLIPGGATKQTWSKGFVSQEIGVNLMTLMFHPWKDHRYFSFGIGFQETRFAGKGYLYSMEGERLVKVGVPEGVSSRGARLDFTGIRFPLSYGFELSSHHVLEFTADINYWFNAKAENLLGERNHEGFLLKNYRPITADARVSWLIDGFAGFYVKYYPPIWFKSGSGPIGHTVSAGVFLRL